MSEHNQQQAANEVSASLASKLLRLFYLSTVIVLIVVLLALSVISTLISTNMGTQWLLNQALLRTQSDSFSLTVEHSLGTLLSGLDLQGVQFSLGSNSVTIDAVQSRWNPMTLLNGEFVLDRLHIDGAQIQWQSEPSPNDPESLGADPFAAFLPLPIDLRLTRVNIDNVAMLVDGTQFNIQSLAFAGDLVNKRLQITRLQLASSPLQISAQAELDLIATLPLSGRISWTYTGPIAQDFENASGDLQLSGNLNTLRLNHQLNHPLELNSDGELRLHLLSDGTPPPPSFEFRHSIAPQVLVASTVSNSQRLRIDSAQVTTAGSFTAIDVSGFASLSIEDALGGNIVPDIELDWASTVQGQQLSINHASISSATGSVQGSGTLQWANPLQLSMQLNIQESDGSAYQAFLPEGLVIGALTGSAQLDLQQADDQVEARLSIAQLTGELNAYPLLIDGDLRYGATGLQVDELNARSGSTQLSVNGFWAETIDFTWQLDASDLSTLSPLISGSINATGAVQGTPETPQIDLTANARDLNIAGTQIATLSASGDYLNNSNRLQLRASGIRLSDNNNQNIDSFEILANGLPADHRLSFSVTSPLANARWSLAGSVAVDDNLGWEGSLQSGEIDSELGVWALNQPASLILSPSNIDLSQQCWAQSSSTLCFDGTWLSDGTVTATLGLNDYPLSHFNAPSPQEQNQSRPAPLLPALPVGSRADGMLNATVSLAGRLSDDLSTLSAQFNLDAGEGQIEVEPAPPPIDDRAIEEQELPETQTFYWRAANVSGSVINGEWNLNSALNFYQPNLADSGMSIQGNANAEMQIAANRTLDGQLTLAFDDLSWIEAFVPSLQNTQGRLTGLSILSGTLDTPRFGGNLSLEDAAVDVPELGLELRNINTTINSDISQTVFIQGQATSGDGNLRYTSEIRNPLSADRRFSLSLTGQNFTLLNDPEILLKITPALNLEGDANAIHISGDLLLPVVDVQISSLPESAVDVSADTVLVSSNANRSVHNAAHGNPSIFDNIAITSELKITLGDEARFRGFGLDTQLAGALDISQRDMGAPLTYGELTVNEGNFQIYGRTLTIEHGKLLFFGSIENPALDIRAVRQAQDVKVGVQMNGTLRNIRSQLFSTPTLPDGDIIAVMLTGRPFAEMGSQQDSNALMGAITTLGINQGQSFTNQVRNQLGLDTLAITSTGDTSNSSLTLGKYLTPKLFIRYGVGLFETESTLSVDYSISERIKLEAKSGSTQSVDLKYTVER